MSHEIRSKKSRREFLTKGLGAAALSAPILNTLLTTPALAIAIPTGGGSGSGGTGSGGEGTGGGEGGGGGCHGGGHDGGGRDGGGRPPRKRARR